MSPKVLFLSIAALGLGVFSNAEAQRRRTPAWPYADSTGESDVYPTGDAIGVYRAVLDLLYIDGTERPPVIVLWDTATRRSGGPCAFDSCPEPWLHKSRIDTATLLSFARTSPKRPAQIDFGYRIPIVRISSDAFDRVRHDGYGYLADLPPDKVGHIQAFWAGFRKKYPRAWGYAMLSKVGFNAAHTEALVAVFQNCGEYCRSFEFIFLKRFGKTWKVVERIPDEVDVSQTSGSLRYRGPPVAPPNRSHIVALDSAGSQPRAESGDAAKVYGAVLDRLYSQGGERPRSIVITRMRTGSHSGLPPHRSKVDSSLVSSYEFYAGSHEELNLRLRYRLPITWIDSADLKLLEREGAPLVLTSGRVAEVEQSALWLAFPSKHRGAWGYASLGRVSFNPRHSQALVYTRHFCGSRCVNSDTWFLERTGESWFVVERMPRENEMSWTLEGLRYLGPDADPKWYGQRHIHGVFLDWESGRPLPRLRVEWRRPTTSSFMVTDAKGRYSQRNPPLGGVAIWTKCSRRLGGKWIPANPIYITPGMDSTFNIPVNLSFCSEAQ